MEALKIFNYSIMAIFFLCYAYQFFYIPVALLKKQKELPEGESHRFAVLIAARNEENVIGDLIDSLQRQTYPAALIDIYVVADNCTDRTADIARTHGAIVEERFDLTRIGKGYALHFLTDRIQKTYDAYIIFDADNIIDPNYIREINKIFSAGYNIVTSYIHAQNYGDNWISAGYGLWFLRDAQYLNRPRMLLGTSCGSCGTGLLFSHEILQEYGGWNFFLLTEDVEFVVHSVVHGHKIGYCANAILYDEQPTSFRQSARQRIRWARGYLQVLRRYGGQLIKGCFRGSFSCFDMLMNFAPAAILAGISIAVNLIAAIIHLLNGMDMLAVLLFFGQSFLGLYFTVFVLGLIATISEWKEIPCTAGKKLLAVVTFPFFMLTYLPLAAIALVYKPSWKPIHHNRRLPRPELAEKNED